MAKRRFKFGDLKNLAKLADQFLDASEHVHDQIKDKDAKEILDLLKNNVSSLKNPKTLFEVQRTLKGKSPKEIKEFFEDNFKELSSKDAADLAKALSEEKGLPGFLSDKLAKKKPEETVDQTKDPKQTSNADTPAANENTAAEAASKPAAETPKKEAPKKSGGGLPWGKMLGTAWDVKQKIDQNRQKEDDKSAKKDENGQNNQKDTDNKQSNNKGSNGRKPGS